jgi:hypothetical protein
MEQETNKIQVRQTNALQTISTEQPRLLQLLPTVNIQTGAGLVEFISEQNAIKPAAAFNKGIQISTLRKSDPVGANVAISKLISLTNARINCVRPMNDLQIGMAAASIVAKYWYLRIEELAYIMREGIGGRWGKLYDRFDEAVIMEWIQTYELGERQGFLDSFVSTNQDAPKQLLGNADLLKLGYKVKAVENEELPE